MNDWPPHIPDQRVSPPDEPELSPEDLALAEYAAARMVLDVARRDVERRFGGNLYVRAFMAAELARDEAREALDDLD